MWRHPNRGFTKFTLIKINCVQRHKKKKKLEKEYSFRNEPVANPLFLLTLAIIFFWYLFMFWVDK